MKQKLSPKAARDKAIRDKKIAMTDDRREKKAENQRLRRQKLKDLQENGKTLTQAKAWLAKHDYDHKDGRWETIKNNRGNGGKGTKTEKS